MTLRQIILELQRTGHRVQYQERKGGGVEITMIDNIKYKARKGNERARDIVGESLTQYQKLHLRNIRTKKGQWGNKPTKIKTPIPKNLLTDIRRIQRKQRQAGLTERVTRKNVRYNLENYGIEETQRLLGQAERYAMGIAYNENIGWLVQRLEIDNQKLHSSDLQDVINVLKNIYNNETPVKESALNRLIQVEYELEKAVIDTSEFKRLALNIINAT